MKDLQDLKGLTMPMYNRRQGHSADLSLRKGEVPAYVGRNENLQDLKILFHSKDPFRHSGIKGPTAQVKLAELYTGRGGRRRRTVGRGGGSGRQSRPRKEKKKGSRLSCVDCPGNSSVAYLVIQNRSLKYG